MRGIFTVVFEMNPAQLQALRRLNVMRDGLIRERLALESRRLFALRPFLRRKASDIDRRLRLIELRIDKIERGWVTKGEDVNKW